MRVSYALSSRQRKELLDRGRPLSIAIPAPDEEGYDETAFVLAALPEIERGWIVDTEETHVSVDPRQKLEGEGLGAMVGRLVKRDEEQTLWHLQVLCVVVRLQAQRVSRQPIGLTAWPGGAIQIEEG